MTAEEMKRRTKLFALEIFKLVDELSGVHSAKVISNQLLRSGTSVGANYRSACRAKSKPDFISKLKITEEEADETIYWMELLQEAHIVPKERISALLKEADEICAILVSSINTSKSSI